MQLFFESESTMNSRTSGRLALALVAILGASGLFAADTAAGKKVNINQASAKELANLPRIGAKVAERIVEYRQAHGSFARVEDLIFPPCLPAELQTRTDSAGNTYPDCVVTEHLTTAGRRQDIPIQACAAVSAGAACWSSCSTSAWPSSPGRRPARPSRSTPAPGRA